MTKKITIPVRPQVTPSADRWVGESAARAASTTSASTGAASTAGTVTKRLTVDLPAETHARFKAFCALRRVKMNDEINAFISRRLDEANDE